MTFRNDMKAVSADLIKALGEPATFTSTFGPYDITVIFDPERAFFNPDTGAVESTSPVADCISAEVGGAKHKDKLRVGDDTFEVIQARPDGYGVTTLLLNRIRTN